MGNGIAQPRNTQVLLKKDGTTADIIEALLDTVGDVRNQTKGFSQQFSPDIEGLEALWGWVKTSIRYIEDPLGVQWIREPARLYHDREGDCKSFTLFIVSVLENIGVRYKIRFSNTETPGSKVVNHVYPVALLNGREIIMDAVYDAFNREANYYYAIDYSMSEIYRLSGIGAAQQMAALDQYNQQLVALAATIPDEVLINDITEMTEGQFSRFMTAAQFDALSDGATDAGTQARYSSAAAAVRSGSIAGIGNLGSDTQRIQTFLAVSAQKTGKAFRAPLVTLPSNMAGVGNLRDKINNVLDNIKDAWKKIVNWVFKTALPTASPFFLYAFIKQSVGPKTDAKRAKAINLINWIQKTGSFDTADAVVSSIKVGIAKKFGKPVETVLNEIAGGKKISGGQVGAVVAIITAIASALPLVLELIQKIGSLFKKDKSEMPNVGPDDSPNPDELMNELAKSGEKKINTEDPEPQGKDDGMLLKLGIPLLIGAGILFMK